MVLVLRVCQLLIRRTKNTLRDSQGAKEVLDCKARLLSFDLQRIPAVKVVTASQSHVWPSSEAWESPTPPMTAPPPHTLPLSLPSPHRIPARTGEPGSGCTLRVLWRGDLACSSHFLNFPYRLSDERNPLIHSLALCMSTPLPVYGQSSRPSPSL